MSIDTNHYIGYYYKCTLSDPPQSPVDFSDESFYRVFDGGGNKDINKNHHIYIPNKGCEGCYHLSKWTDSGLYYLPSMFDFCPPDWVTDAENALDEVYGRGNVLFVYGIITYSQ